MSVEPRPIEDIIADVRRLDVRRDSAERRLNDADRKFGRVVGAVLNGEAEKICARCWRREAMHTAARVDPIGHAETPVCGDFLPLTLECWRERNG